jgi:hypothetical protein
VIGHALRFAHQAHFLGFGTTRRENIVRFAFGFGLALLCALACYLYTDGRGHKVFLVVGLRRYLLKLNALLFGLALRVEHVLALFGQNLLGLRLHQLRRQVYVADEHIHYVHVILQ